MLYCYIIMFSNQNHPTQNAHDNVLGFPFNVDNASSMMWSQTLHHILASFVLCSLFLSSLPVFINTVITLSNYMPNNKQAIDTTCQKCRRDIRATGWSGSGKTRTHNLHSEWVKCLKRWSHFPKQQREKSNTNMGTRTRTAQARRSRLKKSEYQPINALLFACVCTLYTLP